MKQAKTKTAAPRKPKAEPKTPISLEAVVYNERGEKVGTTALPERVFGVKWNPDLVHQAVTIMEGNARIPYAHTKDRGEVRGGGKKPWQQKGTGRARHGSIRSPLWRGGGITFGPTKERVFARELPRKMRAQALFCALSRKFKDGELLFIDKFSFTEPKAREGKRVVASLAGIPGFERLGTKKRNALFIAQAKRDENVEKSFRNFSNVEVGEARNLNPMTALRYTYVAFVEPAVSVAALTARMRAQESESSKRAESKK